MLRSAHVRFSAPVAVAAVFMLLSGALVAEDSALAPGGTFFDDDGSVHEGNIEAIAAAEITRGCNPPINNLYCPGASVTRGQMAAFLRRALELPGSSVDAFGDDDGNVFEDDINAIAAAGVTKGCNPPENTNYCPYQYVKRDQMASFLGRALGLTPIVPPPYVGFQAPVTAFAAHQDVPLLSGSDYAGPTLPTSLSSVLIADSLDFYLDDPAIAQHLLENGFVVAPGDTRLFHWKYDGAPYGGYPVFVTTDAAYNVWHLVFDKILRELETDVLLPELEDLVTGMLAAARSQATDLAATPLSDHALRIEEWFEAAATLLDLDVGPIGARAQAEVDLVLAHTDTSESPTMGMSPCVLGSDAATCVSYATFKPRGHYTRSVELERFFRAMSMFGQTPLSTLKADQVRLASLLIGLLESDPALEALWATIYDPTAFLVGIADDYTPYELSSVVKSVVPGGFSDPLAFVDSATIGSIVDGLETLRPITIDPELPSVRFMGTRVTLDAFILDQLIDPNVGRVDPSALDVAAALGSDHAMQVQLDGPAGDVAEYRPQLMRLRTVVTNRTSANWATTVYDAWLWAIQAVWADHGSEFPDFMRSDAWAAKSLQTGLGSYAELKHDTILYTKPAFAEGDGPPEPDVPPRHWVEPDPVAFQRLSAAAGLMQDGLSNRNLLPTEYDTLITDLRAMLDRFGRIAEDELAGRAISAADNDWLRGIGATLEWMWLRTADLDEFGLPDELDEDAAIIADIATTPLGALEIGTGRIDSILVLVPNDQGVFQVAVGGVYSFYEFWQDPSNRLTDEEWRARLDAGTEPDRPDWQEVLFAD